MGNVRSNFGGGFAMVHYSILDMLAAGKIDALALTVWTYLVRAANEGFTVRRVKTICDATGISDKTVRRKIQMLEDAGVLRVNRRQSEDGSWLANEYELKPPRLKSTHRSEVQGVRSQIPGGTVTDTEHIENSSFLDIQPTRTREAEGIPDGMAEHFGMDRDDPELEPPPVEDGRSLVEETEWLFKQWPPDRVNEPEVQRLYLDAMQAGKLPSFAEVQRNVMAWRAHEDFRDGYRYSLTRMIGMGRLWRHPDEANAPPVAAETRPDPAAKPVDQWRNVGARQLFAEAEKHGDDAGMEEARNIERARWNWRGAA